MWFKTTSEDGERGQQWRAIEDCSTDERLQQETLCHRQWTDEYVERPETLMSVAQTEQQELWTIV